MNAEQKAALERAIEHRYEVEARLSAACGQAPSRKDKDAEALRSLLAELEAHGRVKVPADPPAAFVEWACSAIPPGTIINDPKWWAPRIWRAARWAMPSAAPQPGEPS